MTLRTGLHVALNSTGNGTSPRGGRLAQGGMLARGGPGVLNVRTGVLFDDGTPVVSGTGTWRLSIRAFTAVASYTLANGPVVFSNDGAVGDVEIDPAPGSGSRIDIVWALQPLVAADGGSGDSVQPVFGVASSDPSGSPTPPLDQLPAGAVELSRAMISAGMTSSSDAVWTTPQWTVANGGVIPLGEGKYGVWDGAAWKVLAEYSSGPITASSWATLLRSPEWFHVGDMVSARGTIRRTDMPWAPGHQIQLGALHQWPIRQ
ncbi:hypothetical protein D9V41_14730 [Aeromicrobium phragmitis]|uniref:Minor tail protein n=1 Tax=Aeromicrobium phragmitis TaxID=2478914 RepID=A0A3L8PL96_9ACTN|nr:hypothetical protein [Aeromicrobium phragmitis]RLV54842.1 hypothetical protein D9V41_14730 [Aeromicrobium phragmitis]